MHIIYRERNACIHVRLGHVLRARVFACVHAYAQAGEWRECGATLELDHVRNGWWARLGSRWTSRFYGTMVLRAHLAHPPPSNIPRFVQDRARKGCANSLRYPLTDVILWNHAPIGFADDESGVTLGAFLHGERSPRVSDQRKRVSGGESWFYTTWMSSDRDHSCGLFALRSPKELCSRIVKVAR